MDIEPVSGQQYGYKIFRIGERGQPRFLYHGLAHHVDVPLGWWLEADNKRVRDGSGKAYYESAFHVFATRIDAINWIGRSKRAATLVIVPVYAEETRLKPRARQGIYLAQRIYVDQHAWDRAKFEHYRRQRDNNGSASR